MWRSLERIPSWSGQEGRCSLPVLWQKKMETVICCGHVPFHLYCMFWNSLSFQALWLLIGESGPGTFSGMAGYLVLAAVVTGLA